MHAYFKEHIQLPNHLKSLVMGMTIVELLVVVVIVGILAAVILPSFQQQIISARRGEGISLLLQLKVQQEAYRIENHSYADTNQLSLPQSDYYTFKVTNTSATTYTLIASAKGSQLDDLPCKTMSIDQSMQSSPKNCFY